MHGGPIDGSENRYVRIKNTQKITSAMEMVAASKMRKAQDRMAGETLRRRMRSVDRSYSKRQP